MAKTLSASDISTLLTPALSAGVNVTAATEASPIEITAASHGLVVDDYCLVADVGGQTGANGLWRASAIDGNDVTLEGTTTVGAWTSGGTVKKVTAGLIRELVPGDLDDVQFALSKRQVTRGTDAVRTSESPLKTIFA